MLHSKRPRMKQYDCPLMYRMSGWKSSDVEIGWFWRALRSFSQEERSRFLMFVTSSSRVPLGGFTQLQGSSGVQAFQIQKVGISLLSRIRSLTGHSFSARRVVCHKPVHVSTFCCCLATNRMSNYENASYSPSRRLAVSERPRRIGRARRWRRSVRDRFISSFFIFAYTT